MQCCFSCWASPATAALFQLLHVPAALFQLPCRCLTLRSLQMALLRLKQRSLCKVPCFRVATPNAQMLSVPAGAEISTSYPGNKMDTAFLELLPRRDAGHWLRLLKGLSPHPIAGVRWVTSAGSLLVGGTWSDLPSGEDVVVFDKRALP